MIAILLALLIAVMGVAPVLAAVPNPAPPQDGPILIQGAVPFKRPPLKTLIGFSIHLVDLRIIIPVYLRKTSPDFFEIAHHLIVEFLVCFRILL